MSYYEVVFEVLPTDPKKVPVTHFFPCQVSLFKLKGKEGEWGWGECMLIDVMVTGVPRWGLALHRSGSKQAEVSPSHRHQSAKLKLP